MVRSGCSSTATQSAVGTGRCYLRLRVADNPGVLAEIAGLLGKHDISISSVIQHEPDEKDVPLVIMTHLAADGAITTALAEIEQLTSVRAGAVKMRVLDDRTAMDWT